MSPTSWMRLYSSLSALTKDPGPHVYGAIVVSNTHRLSDDSRVTLTFKFHNEFNMPPDFGFKVDIETEPDHRINHCLIRDYDAFRKHLASILKAVRTSDEYRAALCRRAMQLALLDARTSTHPKRGRL